MIRNWKKAAAVIGALAMTATVVPALSSPASAAVLKPGISSGNGVTPAVANGFPGCPTGTTAYLWPSKSPGTNSPQAGVSITLAPTNQQLPGDDSRYVNFQITGAKMVQAIVKTDVFIAGFITESTVYSYAAPGAPSDTKIHPPTSSNNSPYKVDGYRFCYVRNEADLSITKSASTAAPSQNGVQAVTYTLRVRNAGPDAATGVTVTDTLPGAVTFVSASDNGSPAAGGLVTWGGLTVPADTSKVLTVNVTVNTDAPGGAALTNSATVTPGNETDSNRSNNIATNSDVTVNSLVDVAVTKTVSDTTPNVGDTVTYTITARNAVGNATATGVTITDALPGGVTPGPPTVPDGTTFGNGVWSIPSLARGASTTLTIPVKITGAGGTTIDNTATLTASVPQDTNPGNDSATASLTVNSVDLAVTKTVRDDGLDRGEFVTPGDLITYDVVVTLAAGNVAATGVTVTDVLDAGLSVVSLPTGCDAVGQEITCTIADGELDVAGNTATITYVAKAAAGTEGDPLVNSVSVAGNETDPVPDNNTSSATVNVLPLLDCDDVLELANAGALASVDIRLIGDLDAGTCFPKGVLAGFSETGDFFVGFDGGNPVATRIDIRKQFDPNPGFDLPELLYAQVDPGAEPVPPNAEDFGDLPACNFRPKVAADGNDFVDLIGNSLFPTLTGVLDVNSSTAGQPATSCEVASSEIPVIAGAGFVFEQTTVVYGEFLDPWFR